MKKYYGMTPIDSFYTLNTIRELETETGLTYAGYQKLGMDTYEYYFCEDCETSYPVIKGEIRANGREIKKCLCKA